MTLSGIPLSLDVPVAGWASNGSFSLGKDGAAGRVELILWTDAPDNVYSDPCVSVKLSPPAGTSAVDLAAAVAAVPGTDLVSGPTEASVGGRTAQLVVLGIPEDVACRAEYFHLWYDDAIGGRTPSQEGSTIRTWIVDVDGTLVWIDGEVLKDTDPELEQEMQDIVNSIVFE